MILVVTVTVRGSLTTSGVDLVVQVGTGDTHFVVRIRIPKRVFDANMTCIAACFSYCMLAVQHVEIIITGPCEPLQLPLTELSLETCHAWFNRDSNSWPHTKWGMMHFVWRTTIQQAERRLLFWLTSPGWKSRNLLSKFIFCDRQKHPITYLPTISLVSCHQLVLEITTRYFFQFLIQSPPLQMMPW